MLLAGGGVGLIADLQFNLRRTLDRLHNRDTESIVRRMKCERCHREFEAVIKVQDGGVVCSSCGHVSPIAHTAEREMPKSAKKIFGVLLPVLTFMGFDVLLCGSVGGGERGFAVMALTFASIVIIPGLLVANCWVLLFRWQKKYELFLAGLLLPVVVGFLEYLFVWGS